MLFSKNDERANERVLYKTKPNMILGCKKAIFGVIILVIAFIVSPKVIKFIGEMQVYLISRINLPLTRYAAIAFFVVILIIILYIIWQLLKWFSMEYTLTDTRIIIKSGILSTKKNYMPYSAIQDINSSQGILARLFNVGTVSTFSAYDNNQIKLENISNPAKVEEIIFSNMMGFRSFQEPPRGFVNNAPNRGYPDNFNNREEYYDEYEPITPIGHERNVPPRRDYEYYPEEFSFQQPNHNKYEYEPYDDLDYNLNRAMDDSDEVYVEHSNDYSNNSYYDGPSNDYSNNSYYDEVMDNYSYDGDNHYHNNESESNYNNGSENVHQNEEKQVDDSPETAIRRHFDKFKK